MNLARIPLCAVLVSLCTSLHAVTATGLSSFEGMEQPKQRYVVAGRSFEPEDYTAITDEGNGTFRMALRYGSDGWDGDRDTGNRDRQRAEVKGLGPHQKIGDTFEYATTWRVDPSFRGTTRFFHIFQVKATEGDDGAPLITMSLERDPTKVSVRYWSGKDHSSHAAREFRCVPGQWESVRIRVRPSFGSEGEVLVSVNGDAFTGVTNIPLFRTDASDYRPKWGLYRGVTAGMPLADCFVEHRDVSATRLSGGVVDNVPLETEARSRAATSVRGAIDWLETQPPSEARAEALGAIGVLWEEQDAPAAMNWALGQGDAPQRPLLLLRLYDHWQTRSIDPAFSWLLAHAPSPDLDAILWYQATDTSFRHGLRGESLAKAASEISEPAVRANALTQALARWAKEPQGVAPAIAFLDGLAFLSPAEKLALRERANLRPEAPGRPHGSGTEE